MTQSIATTVHNPVTVVNTGINPVTLIGSVGMYDVKTYGAKGDGVTDDRAALVACFDDAIANLPATVYFPPGDYAISGGIEIEPVQGSRGLIIKGSGANVTRITFNKGSALVGGQYIAIKIIPSVLPSPADTLSEYLEDIYVEDIGFYDADPATHEGGTGEESHAVSMQYVKNGHIRRCSATDIGDEAFNMTFVRRGSISDNDCINVPSFATSGGAITVQHGSSDIQVTNNNLWGSDTPGTISTLTGGLGINIEQVTFVFPIENIIVSGNNVRDFGNAAVYFTASSDGSNNISITGNNLQNCNVGILKTGSNVIKNIEIIGNTFEGMVGTNAYGVRIPGAAAETTDVVISDNVIENCAVGGMELNMSRTLLSNNVFQNCPRGIFIFDGDDIVISSGVFNGCGGTLQEEIEDTTGGGGNCQVSNVSITNSSASSANIKGVKSVYNSRVEGRSATAQENCIFGATNVIGCNLEGGIKLDAAATKGVIANNKIEWTDTGGAGSADGISLAAGNDDYVISGNTIDLSSSTNNQYCIDIAAGATNTLIVGNNLKSLTAGVANTINDNGTGTLADMTIANFTS